MLSRCWGLSRLLDYREAEGSSNPRPITFAPYPLLRLTFLLWLTSSDFQFSDLEGFFVMAAVLDDDSSGDGRDFGPVHPDNSCT